jgi:hypothetical protein
MRRLRSLARRPDAKVTASGWSLLWQGMGRSPPVGYCLAATAQPRRPTCPIPNGTHTTPASCRPAEVASGVSVLKHLAGTSGRN